MGSEASLKDELSSKFRLDRDGIFVSETGGYWSNLDREQNRVMVERLRVGNSPRRIIEQDHPGLFKVIYSPMRQAGLELLELNGNEICVDYGCMWGALTVALARRSVSVLGVDQTMESLVFLKARSREDGLDNISLLCLDLKRMPVFDFKFDVGVVNGVLEWIPEKCEVEVSGYFGKYRKSSDYGNPYLQQLGFLKSVNANLRAGAKLYLAIENRFDFKHFLGSPDPHTGTLFSAFLPRPVADTVCYLTLGRPYVTWLYSFSGIKRLLKEAGFAEVELYMCFPDYRFPERIIPYAHGLGGFEPVISLKNASGKYSWKRAAARAAEKLIFQFLRLRSLAPSIIAIAKK